jgi:hypothetical protein
MVDLLQGDFLDNLLKQPFLKLMQGYQKSVLFLLVFLLLLPTLDTIIAKWLEKKKLKASKEAFQIIVSHHQ